MSHLLRRLLPIVLVVNLGVIGCGGSNATVAKPAVPAKNKPATDDEVTNSEAPGPDCSDGSCFACGPGICIPGFFCDESSSQPNCQWLAKCGRAATCDCLNETLGKGCKCSERSGGIYVKCSA